MGDSKQEGGSSLNDAAANLVKDYAIGKMKEQYEENKGYLSFFSIDGLKVYFDVTNSYVLHKLKIILFPFLLKEDDWKKGQSQNYSISGAVVDENTFTPRNDLQAPDLYIPLMSFVTFILITGYHKADTEKIGVVYSKSIFLWIFEALVQKGLFICFGFGNPYFFELVAYTGYKFVVLCLVVLAQTLGGE